MQGAMMFLLLIAASVGNTNSATITSSSSGTHLDDQSPMFKIVNMLRDIKDEAILNSKQNQMLFDRYGCWVERISKEKLALIEQETKDIEQMKGEILHFEASRGTATAVVKNTKQDIADNKESQKDAEEQRKKERDEYEATKLENENTRGALAEAIKVLAGTGTGGALLEMSKSEQTRQEVAVMSVVHGLQSAVNRGLQNGFVSDRDLHALQVFLQRPTDILGTGKRTLSAAQVGQKNNPFGDYAPRSNVIQGILKQMLADFNAAILKNNAAEKQAVKAYDSLKKTKEKELESLEESLEQAELTLATSKSELQTIRTDLEETEHDKASDEKFLEDTKADAVKKTREWNDRVRFQAEEIKGIDEAITILSSAKALFTRSYTTFFQTSAVSDSEAKSEKTFKHLKQLATHSHSLRLAKIALQFKSGWHFDKVIESLDEMLKVLREEEASDIAHKDRCESAQNANANTIEDLTAEIEKTNLKLKSLQTDFDSATEEIKERKKEIEAINADMSEQLKNRNKENDVFKKANKDDTDAIMVIEQAIMALSKIQKKVSFAALSSNPVYSVDPDEAPDTQFKSRSGTLSGQANVIAILEMCKEDIEKDRATTAADEAEAEADFDKSMQEQTKEVENLNARVATLMKQKADITADTADAEEHKDMKQADLDNEGDLKSTLKGDCAWVEKTFDDRYKKRKIEMASIEEAKEFLSGAK